MLHSRSHIDELQMWQKVKELSSFILTAVQFEVCAYDVRDPTICIAVEMGAHVFENNVWHVRLGFDPSMCESHHSSGGCVQRLFGATPLSVSWSTSLGGSIETLQFVQS